MAEKGTNYEIKVSIEGVEDLHELVNALGSYNEQTGYSIKATERLEKQFVQLEKQMKEMQSATQKAAADSQRKVSADQEAEKSTKQLGEATQKTTDIIETQAEVALPRLRYALYDVATTAGVVSGAITATGVAVLAASASYESAFTDVERTTLATASVTNKLRSDLMQLTREIPESWGFITEIASIGAQLDIAEQDLAQFTETTTKFSTVTGVAAETSAMAFGSLGQLLNVTANEYENMGSAIAYVGVTSVATDAEIIKMSQRLAASAANAGMTAQEVIALSGALASLRVAPERAQGVMEVYFRNLNNAIAEGGERLEAFAYYSGMSTDAVAELVATDPAAYFRALSQGLGQLDPVSTTRALDQLGLSGIRAGEVFTRVSNNLEVFDQAMANSNKAWDEGTHLAHAYGLVVDDLASKWQIFQNAVAEAGSVVGDILAPAAKAVLDFLTPMVHAFSQFANTGFGRALIVIGTALGAVVAILAGFIGTGALALATMAAMKTAIIELNIAAGVSTFSLRGLSAAISQVGVAANVSTGAIRTFKVTLASTGIGFIVVLLSTLAAAFMHTGNAAEDAFNKFLGSAAGLSSALAADLKAYEEAVASGNKEVADSFTTFKGATDESTIAISENRQQLENAASVLGIAKPAVDDTAGAVGDLTIALGENTVAWLQNALMQSEAFQKLVSSNDFASAWEAIGANFSDALHIAASQGEAGVANYFARLANQTNNSALVYAEGANAVFQGIARMFQNFGAVLSGFWQGLTASLGAGQGLTTALITGAYSGLQRAGSLDTMNNQFREMRQTLVGATNQMRAMQDVTRLAGGAFDDGAASAGNFGNAVGGPGGAGKKAKEAAKEIRLLKDYTDDLEKVWSRAFEIRFSGQSTFDDVTSQWSKMAKAIRDAQDAIRKYHAEMATLNADKATMEYWLRVAENYGDTIRANELRAKIGETDNKLAETQKKLAAEQEKTNKTLVGNSDAAIKNRDDILSLVSSYQDHIAALSNSGLSADELATKTRQLREQFLQQATDMGFSRSEAEVYAKAFDDVSYAIKNIPRNVTVEIKGVDPAVAALMEIKAAADAAASSVGGIGGGGGGGGIGGLDLPSPAPAAGPRIPLAPLADGQGLVQQLNQQIAKGEITASDAARRLGVTMAEASAMGIKDAGQRAFPNSIIWGIENSKAGASASSKKIGQESGSDMSIGLLGVMASHLASNIVNPFNQAAPRASSAASATGSGAGSSFAGGTLGVVRGLLPTGFAGAISGGASRANSSASTIGRGAGTRFSNSAGEGARGSGSAMASGIASASFVIYNTATRMGRDFARNLRGAITSTLDSMLGTSGIGRSTARALTGFKQGGYTGNGGVNDVAGVVHGREFVFSAPAVDNLGLRNLAFLHNAALSGRTPQVATSMPSSMVVELSPYDRQLLVDVKNATGISLNGDALQRFVGAGAMNSGRTGRG